MDPSRNYQRAVTPTMGEATAPAAAGYGRGKVPAFGPAPTAGSVKRPGQVEIGSKINLGLGIGGSGVGAVGGQSAPQAGAPRSSLPQVQSTASASQAKAAAAAGRVGVTGISGDMSVSGKSSNGHEAASIMPPLPRYDLVPLSDELPADGVIFTRLRNQPDSLVVFRTPEERARNPERLNLDRRQLDICPVLEQEQRLRLLNYQNNNIKTIQNIDNLPSLIFLDMYNNKLTTLDGPLSNVRGLRVLMAGKNKLTSITNLTTLKKLDVLDLHSNEIKVIEGLSGLNELRVLNLAGNKISLVNNLSSLQSLTELNLRRNSIEKVLDLDKIPALQRVFLSHNNICSLTDIACLYNVKMLIELSLDGNTVSESNPVRYRQRVISGMPTLRHLDLKRITDEEKAAAIESCIGIHPLDPIDMAPPMAPSNDTNTLPAPGPVEESGSRLTTTSSTFQLPDPSTIAPSKAESLAMLARTGKVPNTNDIFDVEIIGNNEKALIIVGEKWDWVQNRKLYANVVEMSLIHIRKDAIINKVVPSMSLLSPVKTLRLINNGIELIRDILQLSELWVPYLEHVIIRDNPINHIGNIYEDFLIVKIPNILTINGEMISQQRKLSALKKLSPILYAVKASKEVPFANLKNRPANMKKDTSSKSNSSKTAKSNWDDLNAADLMQEISSETMRRRSAREAFNSVFETTMKQVVMRTIEALNQ